MKRKPSINYVNNEEFYNDLKTDWYVVVEN